MKKIKLTQNQYAIVDNEDFERVSKFKWHASYNKKFKGYYAETTLKNRKTLRMHRLILNAPKEKLIDHINHISLDNRKSNLRLCTMAQNMWNGKKRKGLSKYLGIYFDKRRNSWVARLRINLKRIYIGSYKNEKEAAIARDIAAKKYHGEFASLNFNGTHLLMSTQQPQIGVI